MIDASQAAPQLTVDVQAVGCDFLVFTGHKVCGPTGIGVLWGREELLNELPPFHGGGEMIETVTMARSTYARAPHRFEAGTPPIVEAIGLGCAVDYLGHIGLDAIHRHEQAVTAYALEGLQSVPGVTVLNKTFFNEMTVRTSQPAVALVERLAARGILAGVPVSRLEPDDPAVANLIVLAATELTTDADIAALCAALAEELQ